MRNAQTTYQPGASQNAAFTGANAAFPLTDPNTTIVRLVADQNCHFTTDGTAATAASAKLIAGLPEYFSVSPALATLAQINVISDGTNGNLNIVEMTQ